MQPLNKKIKIIVMTVIMQHDDKEEFHETYQGSYKSYGEVEIITFLEYNESFGAIDCRIVIQSNKVHLTRSGQLSLQQRFHLHKKTESLYKHPNGNMLMLTETKSIFHREMSKEHDERVDVDYHLLINNEEKKEHYLSVTYMEEK